MSLVCVQWPRLGPPHLSRLYAANRVLARHGVTLVALETASQSDTYRWATDRTEPPFRRVTVFPDQHYHETPAGRLHDGVVAALGRLRPDALLVHSYSTPDARAALTWARRHRRVAVCMAESRAADAPRHPAREAIKRVLVSQFDAALSSGSASTRYVCALGMPPGCVALGYSVVDNALLARQAARVRQNPALATHLPGLADPSPFFLASARFMARKNLPALLRAYGAYREAARAAGHGPWRLVLLGDGALRPELEGLVARRGLRGVEMPGWREAADLPAYYALASAFVHTAEVDQWGLVVNEAMAAGLPLVVSTGTGAAEDLVREGHNGFTFAPADEPALARRLYALAHEVDREAFGQASRQIVAAWPAERFGTGLLEAIRRGAPRARRGLGPDARLVLAGLRLAARSPTAFHAVQD